MTRNWIQHHQPKYVGIIVGDFMGSSLIKEIIISNFREDISDISKKIAEMTINSVLTDHTEHEGKNNI
ncbi:hypothetical protein EPX89_28135 [Escherichia coli]|nr:hypothetical protein [Escherichia coli]